ncbi:hypothetical protein TNCV_2623431 [Trichonephila clavipes]|nr:hypothetical protein TNCV_2623431 [Trichonephila clavipes]
MLQEGVRCFPFETRIHYRRKTDFFPEDTTMSYSGFESTRLQAEDDDDDPSIEQKGALLSGVTKNFRAPCKIRFLAVAGSYAIGIAQALEPLESCPPRCRGGGGVRYATGAAFHSRRESITGESPTSFSEENTTMPYSRFEPEPTGLQAECHIHHTGWAASLVMVKYTPC